MLVSGKVMTVIYDVSLSIAGNNLRKSCITLYASSLTRSFFSEKKILHVKKMPELCRTIGELVSKNQSMASRLQSSLDRLAGISAENQSLKTALKTSAAASLTPVNAETRCQHRGTHHCAALPS